MTPAYENNSGEQYETSPEPIEDESLLFEHSDTIKENNFPSGRVICDVEFVLTQARQLERHCFDCRFNGKMIFSRVTRLGLVHTYHFICNQKLCGHTEKILTDREKKSLNQLAVLGAMSVGNGFSQEEQIFSTMNMSYMSKNTYSNCEKVAGNIIDAHSKEKINAAINTEKSLAEERGDVDKDGFSYICAIVDGGWCKRSYGHGYNSSSGVAVIIGAVTQKILFISVRNKICLVCIAIADGRIPDKKHVCLKNWSGPSTAMESDIIVEGLKYLEENFKVRCTKIIGDGDTNLMTNIQDSVSYGGWVLKIECANHAVRRYFRALEKLQKNTSKFSGKKGVMARKVLLERMSRLVKGAREAIKNNASPNLSKPNEKNIQNLISEILNGPAHVFGKHEDCGNFCKRKEGDSEKSVFDLMQDTGMYSAIMDEIRRVLVSCCHTLVYNLTNNPAEIYMSQLSKAIGGKRIDFAKGGSIKRRANIAALAFQSPGQKWQHGANEAMTGRSPGTPLSKFLKRRRNVYLKQIKRRKLFASRKRQPRKHVPRGGDGNYGDEPIVPDLTPEIIALKAVEHLASIAVQTNNEFEENTREQSNSENWLYERSKRISSTMFKDVAERRVTTLSANLVKRIIYREKISTKAIEYGRANESIAIKAYEEFKCVTVQRCGMFVDPKNPFLCTSPDGLVGTEGLVEIKCPHTAKDSTSLVDVCKSHNIGLKVNNDGSLYLPKSHKYFYQIQGQLAITNRSWCDFFVWSPNDFYCIRINQDHAFWDRIVPKMKQFYMDCCLPEILDSRFRRKLPLREPEYILMAIQKRDEEKAKKFKCKRKKTCNVQEELTNLHSEEQAAEMETSLSVVPVEIGNEYVVQGSHSH